MDVRPGASAQGTSSGRAAALSEANCGTPGRSRADGPGPQAPFSRSARRTVHHHQRELPMSGPAGSGAARSGYPASEAVRRPRPAFTIARAARRSGSAERGRAGSHQLPRLQTPCANQAAAPPSGWTLRPAGGSSTRHRHLRFGSKTAGASGIARTTEAKRAGARPRLPAGSPWRVCSLASTSTCWRLGGGEE